MSNLFDIKLLPKEVPVMDLSNSSLFPRAILPLYIFEERYRKMLDEILSGQRLFAVADLRNFHNNKSCDIKAKKMHEYKSLIAGIGVVRACKKNPDGTSNLILQGLCRIQILHISNKLSYPVAKIRTILPEEIKNRQKYNSIKSNLLEHIETFIQLNPMLPDEILPFLANLDEPENVLDVAIASLCPSGALKQSLLETLCVTKRYEKFLGFLELEKKKILQNKNNPTEPGNNN